MHAPALALLVVASLPPDALPARRPPRPAAAAPSDPDVGAARALALLADGEPGVEEVQRAAAADPGAAAVAGAAGRARIAAVLPKLTAEYRRDDRSYRIVGLQGAGEVDYARQAPGSIFGVRATWDLDALVFSPGELRAAEAASELARRRDERVLRATRLYFERRRLRLELLLAPPADAAERAEREIRLEEVTAEIDALTGGLYRRGRAR